MTTIWLSGLAPCSARADDAAEARRQACGGNAACLIEAFLPLATVACDGRLKQQAAHDWRWVEPAASRYAAGIEDGGRWLVLRGDQIEFQNGFGGWFRHRYECRYFIPLGDVLALNVERGRY